MNISKTRLITKQRPRYFGTALLSLLLLLMTSACSNNVEQVSTEPTPSEKIAPGIVVNSQNPAVESTNISTDTNIQVSFTEAISTSSLNDNTFIVNGPEGKVNGAVTFDITSNTATFTPDSPFNYFTTYTVNITPEVKDIAGNSVSEPPWVFRTVKLGTFSKFFKKRGGTSESFRDLEPLDDGGFIATVRVDTGSNPYMLVKISNRGKIVWTRYDASESVCIDIDKSYISTGPFGSTGNDDQGARISKTNKLGQQIWQYTLGGKTKIGIHYYFDDVACGETAHIYVTGTTVNESPLTLTHFILKFDTNGTLVWKQKYASISGSGLTSKITQASDTGVVVITLTPTGRAIKINANGTIAWQKDFSTDPLLKGTPRTIAKTADGGYIISGYLIDSSSSNQIPVAWIIKLDQFGNTQWQKALGDSNSTNSNIFSSTITTGGTSPGILAYSAQSNNQILTKLDLSGNLIWQKQLVTTDDAAINFGLLTNMPDGGILLSGSITFNLMPNTFESSRNYAWFLNLPDFDNITPPTYFDLSLQSFTQPVFDPNLQVANSSIIPEDVILTDIVTVPPDSNPSNAFLHTELITGLTTVLNTPTDLAVEQASSGQLKISWKNNSSALHGHIVLRSEDNNTFIRIASTLITSPSPLTGSAIDTTPSNIQTKTFTDIGLTANITYYYKVIAFGESGYSEQSNIASGVPL